MSTNTKITKSYQIKGKVQNVMFRQTIIRAMIKRNIQGGATNCKYDKHMVHVTMHGFEQSIEELVSLLRKGKVLNNWGARPNSIVEMEVLDWRKEQVTTANVDGFRWNQNCEMYI